MNLVLGGISMKKKVFSLVLVLCMMLDAFPTSAKAAAIRTQEQAVQWATYCANTGWEVNDGSGYTQCTEFVAAYYEYLTGTFKVYGNASYYLSDNSGACLYDLGWTRPDVSSAQPGDIFIQDGDPGHMGVIVGRSGSTLTTAEANGEKTNEHSGMPVPTGACALYDNRSIYDISGLIRPAFSDPTPAPVAPNAPSVTVSGNSVTVSWNDVANETGYDIKLVQDPWRWADIKYSASVGANTTSYTFYNVAVGEYQAFVISRPNADNVQSGWTKFAIQPEYKAPTVSATVNGKTVDIRWNDVGAASYELHVFNKNTGTVAYSNDMGKALSAHLELSGGTWQANVTALFDGLDGGKAGSYEFTILSSYTVSYDANGGTGAPASQTKTQGTALTLSGTKPTRADTPTETYTVNLNANGGAVNQTSFTANSTIKYAFKNWNTASNGSGTSYAAGASYTSDADATLYAQWESTTITDLLTLPTPSRDGYSFLGWAGSPTDFSGVMGIYTPTATITLYAIWGIPIDEAYFPDANFRSFVSASFDQNSDGYLCTTELNTVESIDCNWKELSSLRGVEFFTELRRLECSMNSLAELDLSKNSKLEHLSCNGNDLTVLDLSGNAALQELHCNFNALTNLTLNPYCPLRILQCMNNQLTTLNVESFALLTELTCGYNQLTALDISGNGNLEHLGCDNNNLSALDVTHNSNLISLACSSNSISSLDVSCNPRLEILQCGQNNLSVLDISNNTELTQLVCDGNSLGALDTSHNTKLEELQCVFNDLLNLDVSNNAELRILICRNNVMQQLTLGEKSNLWELTCEGNQLSVLDISGCPRITRLLEAGASERMDTASTIVYAEIRADGDYASGRGRLSYDKNIPLYTGSAEQINAVAINVTNFPDANFRSYVSESLDTNHDGFLSDNERNAVKSISVYGREIASLQGIGLFPNLAELICYNNNLTSLDLSGNTQLRGLQCQYNAISSLDISVCPALVTIYGRDGVREEREDGTIGYFAYDWFPLVYDASTTLITGSEPLAGVVYVYYYYSDKGFEFGYAGADTIGSEQTETAPEKDGYAFLGWYQVTEKDDNGLAKAYGEKLSPSLSYSYTLEEVVSIVAVYEVVATHSHVWDDGVTTTPATCDVDGVMTYTCSVCGETKTETIPAAGHKWDAGTVTKAATCTEAGVMTYTCTVCGINGTTEIPALGHHYEGGICKTCGEAQLGFAPKIIEGSGGTAHYGSDYSFRSDAAFNTFLAVYVDGAELSATNYTAKEGSTIVTLKGSYIKTLAAGTHAIRIASTLGNADGTFKVSESPKTGDTSDLFKWSFLAVDSFVCLGCLWGLYLLASKKRRAYDPRH